MPRSTCPWWQRRWAMPASAIPSIRASRAANPTARRLMSGCVTSSVTRLRASRRASALMPKRSWRTSRTTRISPPSSRSATSSSRDLKQTSGLIRPGYGDLDVHAEKGRTVMAIGAAHGHRLGRGSGGRHAYQVAARHDAVGRVELDPAGTRNEDVRPGVCRSSPAQRALLARVAAGVVEIAGDEARGETKGAGRLHEEEGEVPAGATGSRDRFGGGLHAVRRAAAIGKALVDGGAEKVKDLQASVGQFGDHRRDPTLHRGSVLRTMDC